MKIALQVTQLPFGSLFLAFVLSTVGLAPAAPADGVAGTPPATPGFAFWKQAATQKLQIEKELIW